MIYNIKIYFMLFIIYAFLGWIMECVSHIIRKHRFVNRGFLIGPVCPIYGFGAVGITLLFSNFKYDIVLLFILSAIVCGVLEYFTSYVMEKLFNARWWDYSKKRFNINGRVCLNTLIPFGILSVLILRFLNPFIVDKLYLIPAKILPYICMVLAVIYLIDTFVSFKIISNFKDLNKQTKDNTEEISRKVREITETAFKKISIQKDKLVRRIRINSYSIVKNIKYTRKSYTQKIRNDIKERFVKSSKLNKRLISAFPNVKQMDYIRKKKGDK